MLILNLLVGYTTITLPINVTRVVFVLKPQTLILRKQFQNQLNNHSTTNRLPYLNNIENIQSIDTETIIELNNLTISERRIELIKSILSNQNSSENRSLLIRNSSLQVRTYLHDLLIGLASNSNISEEDLYRIGDIYFSIQSQI
jgi:hypothetical protein